MNSIFNRSNPAIEKVFAEAGKPEKVMCVPIDYAKKTHTALVCNGAGMQLRSAFNVHNTPEGIAFLGDIVAGLCRKHHIRPKSVIYGGEDGPSFSFNFIHALAAQDGVVVGFNAHDAKAERAHWPASTDKLDLLGIASLIIKKQGRTITTEHSTAAVLRRLTRYREALVDSRTATALRMHHLVDQLLPGFLDAKRSGVDPFSRASLWLMRERFSPAQIKARRRAALIAKLEEFAVQDPAGSAQQVKHLAQSVLPAPAALSSTLQLCLHNEVTHYESLNGCLHPLEIDIARRLAATPGAVLTSVPGIGLTLAAGLYAELADPPRQRALYRLSSYAGIVARLKQSGGPDKEAKPIGRAQRGNRFLKNLIVTTALQIGRYGHPELRADYSRREVAGQTVRLTMARRILRIVCHLMNNTDFFRPPSLLAADTPHEALRQYYQDAWMPMLVKWRNAGAIQQAFAPDAPLEQWRTMLNELYELNLSKLSPQAAQLRRG